MRGRSANRTAFFLIYTLAFSVVLVGCRAAESLNLKQTSIRLASDGASLLLAEDLLNAQEDQQAGFPSTLVGGSRDMALAAIESGEVDAALMLYPPEGRAWFYTPVAREWLVFVVSPDLPVETLSLDNVQALFSGQIVTWQELGGPDVPVQIISSQPGSSSRLSMANLMMNGVDLTAAAQLGFDEGHVLQLVNEIPGSIGYVVHSALDDRVQSIAIENADPSRKNAASQVYPFVVEVVFVSEEEPQGKLRDFLDWVLSDAGQDVVKRRMLGLNE